MGGALAMLALATACSAAATPTPAPTAAKPQAVATRAPAKPVAAPSIIPAQPAAAPTAAAGQSTAAAPTAAASKPNTTGAATPIEAVHATYLDLSANISSLRSRVGEWEKGDQQALNEARENMERTEALLGHVAWPESMAGSIAKIKANVEPATKALNWSSLDARFRAPSQRLSWSPQPPKPRRAA